jgi:hypothetical protein
MGRKSRIYMVYFSEVNPIGFGPYQKYHPDVKVPGCQEILNMIKNETRDAEFVGGDSPTSPEDAVAYVKEHKNDLDGVLVFSGEYSSIPEELISAGIPIVAVARPLQVCSTQPFDNFKGSRVLTASLPAHPDKNLEVYQKRIRDIAKKINTITILAKMRDLKILAITDKPPLGYFEPIHNQIKTTRQEYDEVFIQNLGETFGAAIVTIPQQELFDRIKGANDKKAEEIAKKWIDSALALRGTNESEVKKSARLYVAMKELMETYECNAITTEGFGWPPIGFQKAVELGLPSQGMPTTQFCTDGIAAASETLIDCLIVQQMGLYLNGSAGLLGDYSIDPFIDTAIVAHCEGTLAPFGDGRRSPYTIRNLPFNEEYTGGACAQIYHPINETVTAAKISIYQKKIAVFTGETVSGEDLFQYWDEMLGRSKVAIKTDAKTLLENVRWDYFGHHRVVLFGDHRQQFINIARLIGYDVVEEDK